MARINVNVEELKGISSEIKSIGSTLCDSYFPSLVDLCSEVNSNVQSTDVHDILVQIQNQSNSISSSIKGELSDLDSFIANQLSQYTLTQEAAEQNLKNALAKMASLVGIDFNVAIATSTSTTSTDAAAGAAGASAGAAGASAGAAAGAGAAGTGTEGSEGSEDNYEHGWGDKYGETWSSWWNDVQEAYSDTTGVVSAVVNTGEAILDTAGAIVETVANGISDVAHGAGNVLSWVGEGVGWLFGHLF